MFLELRCVPGGVRMRAGCSRRVMSGEWIRVSSAMARSFCAISYSP
jgi:hypothetical protein